MPYGYGNPNAHKYQGDAKKYAADVAAKEAEAERRNAQIEENLQDGQAHFASAATTLLDIKHDLDTVSASLQSSWLGAGSEAYQEKQGKLTTTVQTASDVMQHGSINNGKMRAA